MEWLIPLVILLWNITAYIVVAKDKRAARKNLRRTPERVFKSFAATFGGPGTLIGFYAVRHKTKHRLLLWQVIGLTVLSYTLLVFAIFYLMNRGAIWLK